MPTFDKLMFLSIAGLLALSALFGMIAIYVETRPPSITEGYITELNHEEEHSDLVMIPMTITTGKTSTTIMQPTYNYYPESFEVVIEDGEEKEDFYVEKSVFRKLKIGDRFRFDDGSMKNNRPKESRDATPEEEKKMEEDN